MFNWLERLWSRDRGRLIFAYHDGTTGQRADPLAVGAAIERECPKYAELLELLGSDGPGIPGPLAADIAKQKSAAVAELVRATRAAFGVTELSQTGGLTQAETLALLSEFLYFLADLAGQTRPFATSQPRASPSPPDSPTPPSAASGSTGTGSPTSGKGE